MQKIAALGSMQNATFEQFDQFGELVLVGIEAAGEVFDGDIDDLVNAVMLDPDTRDSFMQELEDSFSDKKKQTSKPKANPASRKKK